MATFLFLIVVFDCVLRLVTNNQRPAVNMIRSVLPTHDMIPAFRVVVFAPVDTIEILTLVEPHFGQRIAMMILLSCLKYKIKTVLDHMVSHVTLKISDYVTIHCVL